MTHHPTFEQYMSVDNPHLRNDQLVELWAKSNRAVADAHRIPVGYFTDMQRPEQQTTWFVESAEMRGRELSTTPVRYLVGPDLDDDPAEVDRLIDATLRDIERGSFDRRPRVELRPKAGIALVHKPEREPKGPLGLRLRLWLMRVRLWWMVARLDGAREALREAT
jgi:hypothetical protein